MNVKFMNPFVEAANEVLLAEANAAVTRGNLSLQKSAMTSDDVTVLLSMVGQLQGTVMYGMSQQTALNLVGSMMGQAFEEFDGLAQSGIAELGNVITGRATIKLSQAGYVTDISPPTLIHGQGVSVSTLDFSRVVVPLVTNLGEIVVHIALRESGPEAKHTGAEAPPVAVTNGKVSVT